MNKKTFTLHRFNRSFLLAPIVFALMMFVARPLQAQGKTIRIDFSPQVDDYAPVIQKALNEIYDAGGGTIECGYGIYPLKTPVELRRTDAMTVSIAINGLKNLAGERPQFDCVAEPGRTHRMFLFISGIVPQSSLSMSLSSVEIRGNNVPVNRAATNVEGDKGLGPVIDLPTGPTWMTNLPDDKSYGHPFLYHDEDSGDAITGLNLKTMHINDVIIREIYGNGICLANYGAGDDKRMDSPTITDTKIINTWQWKDGFITGDGVMMWFVKNPLIENCVIYNDMSFTHWIGRSGIVLEHSTEGAIIRNNLIGGYGRNIHIEDTYGDHKIIGNKIVASDFGILLNEPAEKDAAKAALVKPDLIKDNYFEYNQERTTYKTFDFGGRRALVDTFILSPKLKGLQIVDNKFVFKDGKPLPKDRQIYIGPVDVKDYAAQGFTVKGNTYN